MSNQSSQNKRRVDALNLLRDLAGESSATYDAVTVLHEALLDAAMLDGMRQAERLRGRAVLEAWSGSLSGLEEAKKLAAKAESIHVLSSPSAEEQRDAAFVKCASLTVERNKLRSIIELLRPLLDRATKMAIQASLLVEDADDEGEGNEFRREVGEIRKQAGLPEAER